MVIRNVINFSGVSGMVHSPPIKCGFPSTICSLGTNYFCPIYQRLLLDGLLLEDYLKASPIIDRLDLSRSDPGLLRSLHKSCVHRQQFTLPQTNLQD